MEKEADRLDIKLGNLAAINGLMMIYKDTKNSKILSIDEKIKHKKISDELFEMAYLLLDEPDRKWGTNHSKPTVCYN
ncbi:hypothetical protein A2422_02020 [Candidatus Woesebacteria bacterium RIFOXYC1_FULL_31_51]|uniref:Uncharacterized protein n=1 Tax=Candidatus Woesebacteria bacterium GW2011_GWC2_31_9 TaxID=1618586 RepID=A0A0F9YK34_9BACT|nr:MAG: hypothetical protein UR17_C0001G0862 [Candidatus Woesebacteria bacterium GW2011_GWF1_31_35]KKP23596.1 MAG: hypothetical protein UR11_C0001G0570 [Candidatus Woesebacteria bacterium GW2011_GWC1_30_29]KKP27023.1 MAG: hypothetical protein UR13_C0001G0118 [Candidatus Woesebacteria bacterium GW2011_GWD1_31_12]KKP27871.1 MAG: hypothetical protein UR16_C0002G0201 [Candidatus Woesebacteria bacterium GW2011_GWB1_31_29]KKP31874.1 MAG: hypothetical protein UR21_C0004G0010 [Candidatus Woesebacteria 